MRHTCGALGVLLLVAFAGCYSTTSTQRGTVMAPHLPLSDGEIAAGTRVEVHAALARGQGEDLDPEDATATAESQGALVIRRGMDAKTELGGTLELAWTPSARYLGGGDASGAPNRAVIAPTVNLRTRLYAGEQVTVLVAGDLGVVSVPLDVDGEAIRDLEITARAALVPSIRVRNATLFASFGLVTAQAVPARFSELNNETDSVVTTGLGVGIGAGVNLDVAERVHLGARGSLVGGAHARFPQIGFGVGIDL